jgi:glycosyltransferase involved in cell wall biosynthesis
LRRGIIIKGYQDVTGRALNILRALDLLGGALEAYDIYIYSTEKSLAVRVQAEILMKKHNLRITLLEKMDHSQLMEYFLKSKIYIGMAVSDGLSTSMVEAMAHGAFPIQSENSAATDFVEHGVSGMILDPWNIQELASAIQYSLKDDSLLDKAAEINLEVINRLYNLDIGISKMKVLYRNN